MISKMKPPHSGKLWVAYYDSQTNPLGRERPSSGSALLGSIATVAQAELGRQGRKKGGEVTWQKNVRVRAGSW